MAETRKGTKWIRVDGYRRIDGTNVRPNDRSTPKTSRGIKRSPRRGSR
jgi:hypothetical protein